VLLPLPFIIMLFNLLMTAGTIVFTNVYGTTPDGSVKIAIPYYALGIIYDAKKNVPIGSGFVQMMNTVALFIRAALRL
jgi:hypothetical protein